MEIKLRVSPAELAAILVLSTLPVGAQDASTIDVPKLEVSRLTGEIELDGALDEPAWDDALRVTLDYEYFPGDNIEPPVATEAFVTYDDRNLYLGFRAFDPNPSEIRAHLMDRDEIRTLVQDDHIVVMIDTFNDERRAFQFRVNPLGVQADAVFSELDGIEDFSWNILWQSKGRITQEGYEVEIILPMNQLRFAAGTEVQTWGFDLGRSYPRTVRHRIANTRRDRNVSCALCQLAKVKGFEGIEPGRNLVIAPTLTADRTDVRQDFPDGDLSEGDGEIDPGLDLRWGVTPNFTLNATLNPDFSQVEADAPQLNVNRRFALFFPERRPFFLEGIDFFSTLIDPVFTRTVADPDWGAKLTGKQGKNAIGVFATQDTVNNLTLPSNQSSALASIDQEVLGSVLRYRRDVGEGSTVGFLYTGREGDDYSNRVAGLDAFLRFSDKDTLSVQYLRSETLYPNQIVEDFDQPEGTFDDAALEALYSHRERGWELFARWRDLGKDFRADFGFMPRVDIRRAAVVARKKLWPDKNPDAWWTRQTFAVSGVRTEDQAGQLTDEDLRVRYDVSGPLQSFIQIEIVRRKEFLDGMLFEDLDGATLFFTIQPNGVTRFGLFALRDERLDLANRQIGDGLLLVPSVELKLGKHLNLQLDHTLQTLDVDGGRLFEANLTGMRLVYQINVRTFVRAVLQYRNIDRNGDLYPDEIEEKFEQLFSQLLFSYRVNAQTVVFLGYSDNRFAAVDIDLTQSDRTFFLKLSYAWMT